MSDILVIASIVVPVSATGNVSHAKEQLGSSSRAYAGNLRSTIRAEKRVWGITTGWMLAADVATLVAAVALGAQVSCSGDVIGATVTCEVTVGDSPYISAFGGDGLGFMRQLTLTLREV